MKSNFSIDVIYDSEAQVFVGTSNDIPGLTIEEESIHEFLQTAMEIVPYLLEENLHISESNYDVVNVDIRVEKPPKAKKQINPIFNLHTYPENAYAIA